MMNGGICKFFSIVLLGLLVGCDPQALQIEGENGAWSPDGKQIAFQRHTGNDYDVGIRDIVSGRTAWVRSDKGESVYPTWTPTGELVYSHCAFTQTAYRAMKTKSDDGFNFYLHRKDGTKERLTKGRSFDSTCAVAPDGSFWFVSSRGCPQSMFGRSQLWYADTPQAAQTSAKVAYAPKGLNGANFGVASPAVSPSGTLIAWAELRDYWEGWTVMLARVGDFGGAVPLLPRDMVGFSPAWHPDGKHLLFTGYRTGDAGWMVYIINVETGAMAKLAEGQNPAVAPDGRHYLFDDTKNIHVRTFAAEDFPRGSAAELDYAACPEKVVMRLEKLQAGSRGEMSKKTAFASDTVWFARTVVDWDGDASKYQNIFKGGWTTSDLGCQLYFAKGNPHFATRDVSGRHFSVCTGQIPKHDSPVTLTGIHTPDAIYVSVNGSVPAAHAAFAGLISTTEPTFWSVGENVNPETKIRYVEIGTGWPKNVPAPRTRKDLFK